MKYYFASLEPAWSKINYHNGIMWEASQHIQLQPSLGNKTNTQTGYRLPLSALAEERGERWDRVITETLGIHHFYHRAVTVTSREIFMNDIPRTIQM